MKKALVIINIGTPDQPEKKAVKRYLTEFLNDGLVIDIPWLLRKILVNLIIIPFRVSKSTSLYKRLWTKEGSPLLSYQTNLANKLDEKLGAEVDVFSAMRYGNPSIKSVFNQVKKGNYDEVVVLPMYPQYATSTTLSTELKVKEVVQELNLDVNIRFIEQFYNHPSFIKTFTAKIKDCDFDSYDHIIFSYHGLPERQVNKIHPGIESPTCSCHIQMPEHGKMCYKATCYETTRLMAKELGIDNSFYSVSFQSRLSKNWLTPFTDHNIEELLKKGNKRILVVAPAFVTDCLETIVEIGFEYKRDFIQNGGEQLKLVESLNDDDLWADTIIEIAELN
ncbi:ferrochelatase [Plebeiibacterium sediminum]|uniref:Ferrochelatase n=1 Tax=Plebeiibacterium sediminum TaxID=2992112 RepID=A0AAE3M252_9BACT|nr:ferrochelatase [Plebeiobacterium sediminum]MCW3785457.1 ferrochelatase [Plebeiobacterium sediminum]